MSFLDNLENNLKSMESREERVPLRGKPQQQRDAERARAQATAPYTEQLRKGPFTSELMSEATRIGHGLRTKVYISWIDNTLRFEAREHRLELKPTPEGVQAQYFVNKEPMKKEIVDLNGSAKQLAERWLNTVGPRPSAASGDGE
jgi:hypothetical protein